MKDNIQVNIDTFMYFRIIWDLIQLKFFWLNRSCKGYVQSFKMTQSVKDMNMLPQDKFVANISFRIYQNVETWFRMQWKLIQIICSQQRTKHLIDELILP
ncbi:unnamed protein product [Paramecium sonneborni]|uniref:Uncharacterized protein n=1 Tax=Paramecium sonneborni TaxID=65129 RepID=A0A8S1M062_9CILI|nr:unnamed protein product [Paramecium sonneborni]